MTVDIATAQGVLLMIAAKSGVAGGLETLLKALWQVRVCSLCSIASEREDQSVETMVQKSSGLEDTQAPMSTMRSTQKMNATVTEEANGKIDSSRLPYPLGQLVS
jgi:hypothetical protein